MGSVLIGESSILILLGIEVSSRDREGALCELAPGLADGGVAIGVDGVRGVAMDLPLHFEQRPCSSLVGVPGQLP